LFREKFGRNPDQPIRCSLILSPEFLGAELLEETWRTLVQAAGESGVDPALVGAMNKTGRIVTEQKYAVPHRFRPPGIE